MEYLLFLQNIREHAPVFINYIFIIISELVLYGGAMVPFIIMFGFDMHEGSIVGFNICGANMICNVAKLFACVYRPWIREPRLNPAKEVAKTSSGYSFPSGHTTMAVATYGSIMKWQKWKKQLVIVCTILTILTAFARNYLGMHTFIDVFAAILFSIVVLIFNNWMAKKVLEKPELDLPIFIVWTLVCIVSAIAITVKDYPVDYAADGTVLVDSVKMMKDGYEAIGMALAWGFGWFFQRRVLKLKSGGEVKHRIARTLGAILSFLIPFVLMEVLLKPHMNILLFACLHRFVSIMCVFFIFMPIAKKIQNKAKNS